MKKKKEMHSKLNIKFELYILYIISIMKRLIDNKEERVC